MALSATQKYAQLLQQEKEAISCIDSFIDSELLQNPGLTAVPLESVKKHIGFGQDSVKAHVGLVRNQVNDYISCHSHLWKIDNCSMVQKVKPELRQALIFILKYVQEKSEEKFGERFSGAKLNNICSQLGEKYPRIKQDLGPGLGGLKSMLLSHPNLFTMLEYDPRTKNVGDILFVTTASVVDGIALFDTNTCCPPPPPDPDRMDGIGRIKYLDPKGNFGFIQEDSNQEVVFFAKHYVDGVDTDRLRHFKDTGAKFRFRAFICNDYKSGAAKMHPTKWRVFRMWPVDRKPMIDIDRNAACAAVDRVESDTYRSGQFGKITPNQQIDTGNRSIDKSDQLINWTNRFDQPADRMESIDTRASRQLPNTARVQKISIKIEKPTRDAACQVEFTDDKEILLRLLRQCPDLLKLVRAVRQNDI